MSPSNPPEPDDARQQLPTPNSPHAGGPHPPDSADPPTATDGWISLAVGALTLLMYPRWLRWASSQLFGTHFDPFVRPDGTPVPYPAVPAFWADLGPTLFGVALLVDGLILLLAARLWFAVAAGLAFLGLATAYNAAYLAASFPSYGLAIASAAATIVGAIMLRPRWRRFRSLRRPPTVGGSMA